MMMMMIREHSWAFSSLNETDDLLSFVLCAHASFFFINALYFLYLHLCYSFTILYVISVQ